MEAFILRRNKNLYYNKSVDKSFAVPQGPFRKDSPQANDPAG
jgi:hypothetical protein